LCVTNKRKNLRKELNHAEKIIKIEPVRQKIIQELTPKKRVCAYCRVSSDSTKQHNSFAVQVEYYKSYIGKKQEWELVEIFADEAKSGTQTKKRDEFLRMMKECENGNIDIIITSQSQGLQEILLIVLKPSES